MEVSNVLMTLLERRRAGEIAGIPSICSSHPLVIEAALRRCRRTGTPVLIEATCNQVNQEGGYTGMTPRGFVDQVGIIAEKVGVDTRDIILGGDHLGPNPWRKLAAPVAMAKAEAMVAAFVTAGFSKIHLDPSMGCAGEPEGLDDAVTAQRTVRLARAAEAAARTSGLAPPLYVVGTEVPPPGGARHALDHVEPTSAERARATLAIFRGAFEAAGLAEAFARVVALVVQPGVEFGHDAVAEYDPARAQFLSRALDGKNLIFEAHSTDYQSVARLTELVRDRFCILKVGPALTFALRETLYGLDFIASELVPDYPSRALAKAMENLMLAEPRWWAPYYPDDPERQRIWRHYSYSDRIRYYWPYPEADAAVRRLLRALSGVAIPAPMARQFLPHLEFAKRSSRHDGETVLLASIDEVLGQYAAACAPGS
jgi:D-tagatose-1,6-bisphosphate aldolase subunit GatZ/KbaZ